VLKIGLTGGIASGKSTIADMFVARGAELIDTDLLARELVKPGCPALAAIAERFGHEIIGASGELRRSVLRTRIFGNESERRDLESILHPLIRARVLKRLEGLSGDYVVIAVPLLVEAGFESVVDRIIVVDCPREQQLERLMERDRIGRVEAERALAAQAPSEARLALADYVIDNAGDLAVTAKQVETVHQDLMTQASDCRSEQGRAE
jgi:dephospho-CoA kinase